MSCCVDELQCVWITVSMYCCVYVLLRLWIVVSLNCHVYELSCLWIVCLWIVCLWIFYPCIVCPLIIMSMIVSMNWWQNSMFPFLFLKSFWFQLMPIEPFTLLSNLISYDKYVKINFIFIKSNIFYSNFLCRNIGQ